MTNKKLKVIDLFCGGGGLSAGFEQAGFEIILGLDHDKSSVETFLANHQNAKARKVDLRHFDVSELPQADVLIGGPPCTQFSTSKSNKTRNVLDGMELVQTFLRAVYLKKPKYWVMENVAAIQKYLPTEIPLTWIGLDIEGMMDIPNRVELVAADFGIPQRRVRYLIGNFPTPISTHSSNEDKDLSTKKSMLPWRTLGQVISEFPSPLKKTNSEITDPNYDLKLNPDLLTDHYYDTTLAKDEIRALRKAKELHPYMGYMSFTEDFDKPARTVVATQLGRETLVIEESPGIYRRLTVRECATIQTFPITFQFMGSSYASKYKLVGNAVPPKLAFHIAQQIRQLEGLPKKEKPEITKKIRKLAETPVTAFRNGKRKGKFFEFRKFSESIPGKEQRGCRCEFDNRNFTGQSKSLSDFKGQIWSTRIYVGEGKGCRTYNVDLEIINSIFQHSNIDSDLIEKVEQLKLKIVQCLEEKNIPNGRELQRVWGTGVKSEQVYEITDEVSALVDQFFPKQEFKDQKLQTQYCGWFPSSGIRIRILLGALVASLLTRQVNQAIVV